MERMTYVGVYLVWLKGWHGPLHLLLNDKWCQMKAKGLRSSKDRVTRCRFLSELTERVGSRQPCQEHVGGRKQTKMGGIGT